VSGSPAVLDAVLAPGALTALFQPVFDIGGDTPKVHYLEGLVRGPAGTNMESASTLFEYVRRKRAEAIVDRACMAAVLAAAASLRGEPCLALNVHAVTLARDPGFPERLAATAHAAGIRPSRLMVEIVEHAPSSPEAGLGAALQRLRDLRVAIALDDVGFGHSNYALMLDVRPDYFKLDRRLVHGCHADAYRRAVIESVVDLARKVKARVIAEGVEVAAEEDALREMGISLAQGWFFSPALTAFAVAAGGYFGAAAAVPRSAAGAAQAAVR
jgi:EAL domain-containing protein (putative c-di-GMP-specific phosphodiesterase class I)